MREATRKFNLLHWIKRNYLGLIIIFLASYLFLAFLAPILMRFGFHNVAKPLYRAYSNLCHQFSHRSWFLFGKQTHYPLEQTGEVHSIFEFFDVPKHTPEISRVIIGNPTSGYKVAICQRDVALYGAMLLFAVVYLLAGKRIKKMHFALWVLIAVVPIGIDGLLQLAASSGWFPISYESTPMMRTITGALFGFFSGWLLFPAMDITIQRDLDER